MKQDKERNAGFVALVRDTMFKPKSGGQSIGKKTTQFIPRGDGVSAYYALTKWYQNAVNPNFSRLDQYKVFDFLDRNLAEGSTALNIYADNIVSGAIGGAETYKVLIEEGTPDAERKEALIKDAEDRTGIKKHVWEIARDLTKFGDDFEEVVVIQTPAGDYLIDKLKKLPEGEIFANVDERGVVKDNDYPYYQKAPDMPDDALIYFDWWRLIHFKIGRGTYGFGKSLFSNASQRIGRQLLWMDDCLVIGRITRAWMRYAFGVDVTNLPPEEVWEYLDKFKSRVTKKEVVERSDGRILIGDNPPMVDEDIFYPIREGSNQDVKVLSGDANIGSIDDMKYVQTKFLMAVSVPKAYVGLEADTRSRATLTQIDVQFSRQVRRRQYELVPGLERFYEIVFTLAGIDPNSFAWSIQFPELNTTDELLQWEMMKLKAEVAKTYVIDIGCLNNEWIYDKLLGFTQEEKDLYAEIFEVDDEDEGQFLFTPEQSRQIRQDPAVRTILHNIKDLVAYKQARAADAKDKKEV